MTAVLKYRLRFKKREETESNWVYRRKPAPDHVRFTVLTVTDSASLSEGGLTYPAFPGLTNLPFWNRKPRVSLISGLKYSEFSLNLVSETGRWSDWLSSTCLCDIFIAWYFFSTKSCPSEQLILKELVFVFSRPHEPFLLFSLSITSPKNAFGAARSVWRQEIIHFTTTNELAEHSGSWLHRKAWQSCLSDCEWS